MCIICSRSVWSRRTEENSQAIERMGWRSSWTLNEYFIFCKKVLKLSHIKCHCIEWFFGKKFLVMSSSVLHLVSMYCKFLVLTKYYILLLKVKEWHTIRYMGKRLVKLWRKRYSDVGQLYEEYCLKKKP